MITSTLQRAGTEMRPVNKKRESLGLGFKVQGAEGLGIKVWVYILACRSAALGR